VELAVRPEELQAGRTQSSLALLAQDRARKRIDALLTEVAQKSPLISRDRAVEVCLCSYLTVSVLAESCINMSVGRLMQCVVRCHSLVCYSSY
jgi:hypothetical protein